MLVRPPGAVCSKLCSMANSRQSAMWEAQALASGP